MSADLEKQASPWSEIEKQSCAKFQWSWLLFNKEMEGFTFAAQEQAVSTNAIKAHIYHSQISARCRLCGLADETFTILSAAVLC